MSAATTIRLDEALKDRLRQVATASNRTAHRVMCEAITEYVERAEKREALKHDVLCAWEEYQETGLHVSAEEVDSWLASWGTENELPAPTCHK